ncbi:MAG: FHA domain-containing protein, partial [Phycisphaerae bacterium]|nr:FHA domain-containing protein [Phycisphaerae bacterium]
MVLANNVGEARSVPPLQAETPRLRIGAPSYNPDFFAETAELVTLIGSRRDCHLPVPLTDISKIHCAICNTGRDLLICDLRSRTGTFVNEQQTLATALSPGDTVRIANVPIELEFVRPPAPAASPEAAMRLSRALRIALPGRTLTLETQPIVIGKRSNCDIVVDTPDVSLAHALVFAVCGCPVIYDLGSRSGTLLNGKRVTLAWLKDGDHLGIGGESLVVGWDGPTFEPPPVAAAVAVPSPAAAFDLGGAIPEMPASAVGPSALENMIASLQGQLAAFRTRLEKRAVELDQRSAQVDALMAELTQQRMGLEAMRTQVAARADRLEHDRRQMLRRRSKLRKALIAYREHKERLDRQQADLAAALHELEQERQRILGIEQDVAAREGRLGTALHELGFITEERLADALARAKGVPAAEARSREVEAAPLVPRKLAQRHKV